MTLKELLINEGEYTVGDDSTTVLQIVESVLELYPSAHKLALCTLANALIKTRSTVIIAYKDLGTEIESSTITHVW